MSEIKIDFPSVNRSFLFYHAFTLVTICMLVVLTVDKVVKDPIIRWQNRIYAISIIKQMCRVQPYRAQEELWEKTLSVRMTRLQPRHMECNDMYPRQCLEAADRLVGEWQKWDYTSCSTIRLNDCSWNMAKHCSKFFGQPQYLPIMPCADNMLNHGTSPMAMTTPPLQ